MIKNIPLLNVPNQVFSCQPSTQKLTISIYKQGDLLYADVSIGKLDIITGAKCIAGVSLNQYNTILDGYLTWYTKSGKDPVYENLGLTDVLLWSDIPLSDIMYNNYVSENLAELQKEFG